MSRILITGGAGMIGNETSKMLSENGYKVRIIDLPEEFDYDLLEQYDVVGISSGASVNEPVNTSGW